MRGGTGRGPTDKARLLCSWRRVSSKDHTPSPVPPAGAERGSPPLTKGDSLCKCKCPSQKGHYTLFPEPLLCLLVSKSSAENNPYFMHILVSSSICTSICINTNVCMCVGLISEIILPETFFESEASLFLTVKPKEILATDLPPHPAPSSLRRCYPGSGAPEGRERIGKHHYTPHTRTCAHTHTLKVSVSAFARKVFA